MVLSSNDNCKDYVQDAHFTEGTAQLVLKTHSINVTIANTFKAKDFMNGHSDLRSWLSSAFENRQVVPIM